MVKILSWVVHSQYQCHEKMLKEKHAWEGKLDTWYYFKYAENMHSTNVGHKYSKTCLGMVLMFGENKGIFPLTLGIFQIYYNGKDYFFFLFASMIYRDIIDI